MKNIKTHALKLRSCSRSPFRVFSAYFPPRFVSALRVYSLNARHLRLAKNHYKKSAENEIVNKL
jgi:hypothetical protein